MHLCGGRENQCVGLPLITKIVQVARGRPNSGDRLWGRCSDLRATWLDAVPFVIVSTHLGLIGSINDGVNVRSADRSQYGGLARVGTPYDEDSKVGALFAHDARVTAVLPSWST